MDDHPSGALLVLRRYIAAPVPGTALRLCGLFAPDEHRLRLRLTDDSAAIVALDLPTAPAREHGVRWYATALRHAAGWMTERGMPRAGSGSEERVDGAALMSGQGALPHEPEDTTEDALDYLIGDLVGDPLWHAQTASAEPRLYTLLGSTHKQAASCACICATTTAAPSASTSPPAPAALARLAARDCGGPPPKSPPSSTPTITPPSPPTTSAMSTTRTAKPSTT